MKVQFLALHRMAPSSVTWELPSPSLDIKRCYRSQGKASPPEHPSKAGVKGHNIRQAARGRSYSCHSN